MSEYVVLAKLCTTLSECPKVETDGTVARIVGIPAPETEGVGPDEVAVSLPLSLLLYAVDAYRAEQAQHPDKTVGVRVIEQSWTGS